MILSLPPFTVISASYRRSNASLETVHPDTDVVSPPVNSGDDAVDLIHAPDRIMIRSYGSAMHKKVFTAGRTKVLTAKCNGEGCTYMSTCYDMAVQHETTCTLMPTNLSINAGRKTRAGPSRQCSLSTCENQAFHPPTQTARGTLAPPMCNYHIYCTHFRRAVYRDGKWMIQNPGDPEEWIEWPYPSGFDPQLSHSPRTVPSWMDINPSYATTHGCMKFLQAAECVDGIRGIQNAKCSETYANESEVRVTNIQCSDCNEKAPKPNISRPKWSSVGVVVREEGKDQCDGVVIDYLCVTHALERGREMVDENNDIANVSIFILFSCVNALITFGLSNDNLHLYHTTFQATLRMKSIRCGSYPSILLQLTDFRLVTLLHVSSYQLLLSLTLT